MRAAVLPASMAITQTGVHYVVTAVNSSSSFQLYKQHFESQPKGEVDRKFRVDSLLPYDWSQMLHMCRTLSHPYTSYTFTSPGDMNPLDEKVDEAASQELVNNAFIHVVERTPKDFVPNNLIYHDLQKYTARPASTLPRLDVAGEAPKADASKKSFMSLLKNKGKAAENAAPKLTKGESFSLLLHKMQSQPALRPDQLVSAGFTPSDSYANVSVQEKAARDPLNHEYDALKYSVENLEIDPSSKNTKSTKDAEIFRFYPHEVNVRNQIPFRSKYFCVLVNLMPIVPNHMMVVPLRCVSTIHGLQPEEVEDWGHVVHTTIRVLNEVYGGKAAAAGSPAKEYHGNYSIAIQQGGLAGQTVPHLHTHVIPFDTTGKLAGEPESDNVKRTPRSAEMMRGEVDELRPIFERIAKETESMFPPRV